MYNSKWHENKLMRQLELMRMVVALICWGESLRIKNFKLQGDLKIYLASEVAPWVVIAQSTIQTYIKSWPRLQLLTNLPLASQGQDFIWLLLQGVCIQTHTNLEYLMWHFIAKLRCPGRKQAYSECPPLLTVTKFWWCFNHLVSQFLTCTWACSYFPEHCQSHLCPDRHISKQSKDTVN